MRTNPLRSIRLVSSFAATSALVLGAIIHTPSQAGGGSSDGSSGGGDPWENEVVLDGAVSSTSGSSAPAPETTTTTSSTIEWLQLIATALAFVAP